MLLVADVLALIVALAVAQAVATAPPDASGWMAGPAFGTALVLWVLGAKLYGLYDHDESRTTHSTIDEISSVFHLATVLTWLIFAGTWLDVFAVSYASIIVFWLSAIPALGACRALARAILRRQPAYIQNTVIVGAGDVGRLISRRLLQHPEYGINLVGFIDAEPKASTDRTSSLIPILGSPDDLGDIVRQYNVERVIIAFSKESHVRVLDLVRSLRGLDVQVDIVPRLFEILGSNMVINAIEGVPIVSAPPFRLTRSSRFLKRTMDLVLSSLALLATMPLLLVIAVLIKATSAGPVLFRQTRMGAEDRPFKIYKFRTMYVDADGAKQTLAKLNKHNGDDPRMFKIPGDPRVTGVGKILRRLSLDELPQLINVIKGDMSLVGPRPLILEEDQHVDSWGRRRLDLRPGVTGPWQVLGRSDIPFEEMLKLDYLYVTGWTVGEDLKLLLKTLPAVVSGRGSY